MAPIIPRPLERPGSVSTVERCGTGVWPQCWLSRVLACHTASPLPLSTRPPPPALADSVALEAPIGTGLELAWNTRDWASSIPAHRPILALTVVTPPLGHKSQLNGTQNTLRQTQINKQTQTVTHAWTVAGLIG